jgi:NADH-quinone oxidoreductase subunit M
MLWLYRRVIFGALVQEHLKLIRDLRWHEMAAFAPLALLVLLMGIYPALFLDPMAATVDRLLIEAQATAPTELASQSLSSR